LDPAEVRVQEKGQHVAQRDDVVAATQREFFERIFARKYDITAKRHILLEFDVLTMRVSEWHTYAVIDQIKLIHLVAVLPKVTDEDVVRLEVAVHEAERVKLLQQIDHLKADGDDALLGEVPVHRLHDVLQIWAKPLLNNVGLAV
jgi:hypothetical protein